VGTSQSPEIRIPSEPNRIPAGFGGATFNQLFFAICRLTCMCTTTASSPQFAYSKACIILFDSGPPILGLGIVNGLIYDRTVSNLPNYGLIY
jgi:hypothetical protein